MAYLSFGSLKNRHNGVFPKAISNPQKRKLTATEEEVLVQRILSLDKQGFPPRPVVIQGWANLLLANCGITLAS